MQTLEIADLRIAYRTIGDLHAKVRQTLADEKQKRQQLETDFHRSLRQSKARERALERFLGTGNAESTEGEKASA